MIVRVDGGSAIIINRKHFLRWIERVILLLKKWIAFFIKAQLYPDTGSINIRFVSDSIAPK